MSRADDQPTPIGNGIAHETGASPSRLVLRRLGIDTYQEHIVYMRADCHVCRSEGFEARSRVRVSTGGKSLLATLNVINSELLAVDEASLSEAAWLVLGARDGDVIDVTHAEPVESERFVRAKAYGERLPETALSAIVSDIAQGHYSDLHLAAFVTACVGNRLDLEETIGLTRAMISVGDRISWPRSLPTNTASVASQEIGRRCWSSPSSLRLVCRYPRPLREPSRRRPAPPTRWRP